MPARNRLTRNLEARGLSQIVCRQPVFEKRVLSGFLRLTIARCVNKFGGFPARSGEKISLASNSHYLEAVILTATCWAKHTGLNCVGVHKEVVLEVYY